MHPKVERYLQAGDIGVIDVKARGGVRPDRPLGKREQTRIYTALCLHFAVRRACRSSCIDSLTGDG